MAAFLQQLMIMVGELAGNAATWLLIIVIYLAWRLYREKKERYQEVVALHKLAERLETRIQHMDEEERRLLLDVINKYHDGYKSIKEILLEVKGVLKVMTERGF